ncbi:MAG TPA: aminotransferase class III-fold pyridoxal phosphate-dependent enzyme [Gaiellaceae bacterium]|nr:aminotransferase class III-fold pyridoxal phosphate-dependent enzyme [Gaiellaceae bacterium]
MSHPSGRMRSVLESTPPCYTAGQAARIAAEAFGIDGRTEDLGSERDQTFLIDDGAAGAVLKISNSAEDPAVLDLEAAAIAHVLTVDPGLPVARPLAPPASFDGHHVRLFERLRGRKGGAELTDAAVSAYGETHARLNLALRSFFHPAAGRDLLWDVRQTPGLRPLLDAIEDGARRALVARTIDRFEERVLPRWPELRAHVVHGDLNLDNVLLDGEGRVSGIVDFGDCSFTAHAGDLAVGVASLLRGRPPDDVFRVARLALDGYQRRLPLEPLELELLGDLVTARFAAIVAISAWRARRYPANAEYIRAWDGDSWPLLALLGELDPERVAAELGAEPPRAPTAKLAERRRRATGAILTPLTYKRPVHAVRGEGTWLYEADGARLLDAYNNVPVVGHCHPRVAEAVARQTRLLNTHARYLYEPLVELAERLVASFPAEAGLDTVVLLNSGSEANDLAVRLARGVTGNAGLLVTEHAYHGVTAAASDLSPEEWDETASAPPHVGRIPPPLAGSGFGRALDAALERLDGGLAATFLDGSLMSDGIHVPGSEELRLLLERTHATGGLYVADEVQAGHGRTGELWSFARHGIAPDVVTLGKPMGNGYPVAAVVTRRDLAERFAYAGRTFSTFGGNPVAARAALAVLDVLADERLPERAAAVGERLRRTIAGLGADEVLDVRGLGLLAGVQLGDAARAAEVVDRLRERGVLVGRTGSHGDVLKIRPPLVFGDEHADLLVAALERALS